MKRHNKQQLNESAESQQTAAVKKVAFANDSNEREISSSKKKRPRTIWRWRYWRAVARNIGLALFFVYGILPCFILIYPQVVGDVAFLTMARWPPFVNLSNPAECGMNWTRNFYLNSAENVKLGVWHTLPQDLHTTSKQFTDEDFVEFLTARDHPVMLYFHGNAGTRAGWHRMQLYKLFAELNYHVIALDYRGFGDSAGYPTEDGVCNDSYFVYRWLVSLNSSRPIHIWGHSMGSGIATRVSKRICDEGLPLSSVTLEAPFNNAAETSVHFPLARPFVIAPWFKAAALTALSYCNITLQSDVYIADVTVPLLILHAEDDVIVPIALGRKLYEAGVKTKRKGGLHFITFDGQHGYGHKHLHYAPELPQIIRQFVAGSLKTHV